jgi:predicted methyltransferase
MIKPLIRVATIALFVATPAFTAPMAPIDLANRPAAVTAQDAARKPVEVLAASGIQAGDTIIDVMPGAGYYAELIGRGVGPRGKVLAIEPPAFLDDPKAVAAWDELIKRQPNVTLVKSMPADAPFRPALMLRFST